MEFYPTNPSLDDELVRLFRDGISSKTFPDSCSEDKFDVEEEFQKNGRDCIYEEYYNAYHHSHDVMVRQYFQSSPKLIDNYYQQEKRRQEPKLRKNSLDDSDDFYTTSTKTSTSVMNFEMVANPRPLFPYPGQGRQHGGGGGGECVFCRNNGEMKYCYASHTLKDRFGKVTCPILRAYTCPICKVSGDMAHTVRYCPKNKNKEEYIPRTANVRGFIRSSAGRKLMIL